MNTIFTEKLNALNALTNEFNDLRNFVVKSIIDKMTIGEAYTLPQLMGMTDFEIPAANLTSYLTSLVGWTDDRAEYTNSCSYLRNFIGSGVLSSDTVHVPQYSMPCDADGNVIPGASMQTKYVKRTVYIRNK